MGPRRGRPPCAGAQRSFCSGVWGCRVRAGRAARSRGDAAFLRERARSWVRGRGGGHVVGGAGPERGVSSRGSDFLPEAVESPAGLVKPGSAVAKFGVLVGEVVV